MSHAPASPPPGSVPGGFSPADMEGMMDDDQAAAGSTGSSSNPSSGTMGNLGNLGSSNGLGSLPGQGAAGSQPKPPRPITSPLGEAKYLAQDVGQSVLGLLPETLQQVLGLKSSDTPEQKAKKQQMLQNYQRLSAEDQAYVREKMQRQEAEKQQKEQEELMKKQQAEAQQDDGLPMPAGKVTGEAAAGASSKQRTVQKLQSDRKKLSSSG